MAMIDHGNQSYTKDVTRAKVSIVTFEEASDQI
jgi:hypothetical protein